MGISHIVERIEWLLDNATECWSINDENNCLTYVSGDDHIVLINDAEDKIIYIIAANESLVIPEMLFREIYDTLASYFIDHSDKVIEYNKNNVINLMEILHGNAL